jgi:hypothetical protein
VVLGSPHSPNDVNLTPEFTTHPKDQVETLIHEALHLHGLNQSPYQKETYDSKVFGLSTREALNNADSVAQFAIQ